jgi:hypothetical protein
MLKIQVDIQNFDACRVRIHYLFYWFKKKYLNGDNYFNLENLSKYMFKQQLKLDIINDNLIAKREYLSIVSHSFNHDV